MTLFFPGSPGFVSSGVNGPAVTSINPIKPAFSLVFPINSLLCPKITLNEKKINCEKNGSANNNSSF